MAEKVLSARRLTVPVFVFCSTYLQWSSTDTKQTKAGRMYFSEFAGNNQLFLTCS